MPVSLPSNCPFELRRFFPYFSLKYSGRRHMWAIFSVTQVESRRGSGFGPKPLRSSLRLSGLLVGYVASQQSLPARHGVSRVLRIEELLSVTLVSFVWRGF